MFWLLHVFYCTSLLLMFHNHCFSWFSAVSPVIARSPSVLSAIEDQQVTLPCVLLAGNPLPSRQWLHNYGLVRALNWARLHFLEDLDDPSLPSYSFRWPQTSMWQWGGTAVFTSSGFVWITRVTTPAWLKTLLGSTTTPPHSTSMVVYEV